MELWWLAWIVPLAMAAALVAAWFLFLFYMLTHNPS